METGAGRRADERKVRQVEPDGVRAGALADDDVDGVVLHRGIEDLLHRAVEAVDLIDKENVVLTQVGQKRREVARLFDGGAGGDADVAAERCRERRRQRGFAQAGRAVEQHVVQGLSPLLGGLDEHGQVVLRLLLADILPQGLGPEGPLLGVLLQEGLGHDGLFINVGPEINAQVLTLLFTLCRRIIST